jgi:hypothetical protein
VKELFLKAPVFGDVLDHSDCQQFPGRDGRPANRNTYATGMTIIAAITPDELAAFLAPVHQVLKTLLNLPPIFPLGPIGQGCVRQFVAAESYHPVKRIIAFHDSAIRRQQTNANRSAIESGVKSGVALGQGAFHAGNGCFGNVNLAVHFVSFCRASSADRRSPTIH